MSNDRRKRRAGMIGNAPAARPKATLDAFFPSFLKKPILPLFYLIVVLSLTLNGSICRAGDVDWASLQKAFENYANCPSPLNASDVMALLPVTHVVYDHSQQEKTALDCIYDGPQFKMLERQVISRDPSSVRLAFRLFAIADGGFSEDLNILLGTLIRIDPKLFLEELKSADSLVPRLDALLGNAGPVYVDRRDAQCLESRRRIEALETVDTPSLLDVRDTCLDVLKKRHVRHCRQD